MIKLPGLIVSVFMFPFVFIGFISAMIYVAVRVGIDCWHDFIAIYLEIDKNRKKVDKP